MTVNVRWASLIASPDGEVDYQKVRSLVSILLAMAGGVVAVAAAVREMLHGEVPHDAVLIAVGALVLPITGGKVAEGIGKRLG